MKSTFSKAVARYFKTTTLHGLKYLVSPYYSDRVGWVICFIASACCAGMLCTALWARFLNLPALLALRELTTSEGDHQTVPIVAISQPPDAIAESFLGRLVKNEDNRTRLSIVFANAIQGKATDKNEVRILYDIFKANNLTLLQILEQYSVECTELISRCRWQNVLVPCGELFVKRITPWGVCCLASSRRFAKIKIPEFHRFYLNEKLELVLNCRNGPKVQGCEFFTKYTGEEWISPLTLAPGYVYYGELIFTVEQDSNDEKLVAGTCLSDIKYSRRQCLLSCKEAKCGCYDPLNIWMREINEVLPACHITKISCVKTISFRDHLSSCVCLPACKKVISKLILESGQINNMQLKIDPLTSDLNASQSVYLRLVINMDDSRMLSMLPTETWVTLLSSLGGVFNMFLGVGLFSALEFLYFLFVKLPAAIRHRPEKDIRGFSKPINKPIK